MKAGTNAIIDEFRILRTEIEGKCQELHQLHNGYTKCKKGCDQCCMDFRLLPVEFHAISGDLKKEMNTPFRKKDGEGCIFLITHVCSIYNYRPVICRSHGLPILNMDEEGENMELSFCPLNFEEADDDFFTMDNSYQQDYFNSKMYLLNLRFIEAEKEMGYSKSDLIPLSTLAELG